MKKNRNLPPGHAIYSIRFQQATLTCPTSWKTKWKKEGQTWGRTRIGHCLHNAGMCIKTHKNSAPYEYQLFFKLEFSKATLSLKPARFQCELKSWSLIIHPSGWGFKGQQVLLPTKRVLAYFATARSILSLGLEVVDLWLSSSMCHLFTCSRCWCSGHMTKNTPRPHTHTNRNME